LVIAAIGGLVGGLPAAAVVIGVTQVLKGMIGVVSSQDAWLLVCVPILGLGLSVLALYGVGTSGAEQAAALQQGPRGRSSLRAWRTFPPEADRADLNDDIVNYAGAEEGLPWRLAPLRLLAVAATVGLGGPLGTEKPAAYLGVAVGVALGDRGQRWRRFLRPAAVAGGAAAISALMGIPLAGPAYVLELGHRHGAPLSAQRVTAGLVGGAVGWLMNIVLGVDLFRLVVPREPPHTFFQAAAAAVLIGSLAGVITTATAEAIESVKAWQIHPVVRLGIGGLSLGAAALSLAVFAAPSAAVGPGGGAIDWVESHPHAPAMTVLAVALLRAVATTAAVAAGGCGGLFVPYMAVGDLAGRVVAPGLGVPGDLAGSAGATSGIAGGYRLPFTAIAVVLGQGGPPLATLTCLATATAAAVARAGAQWVLDRFLGRGSARGVARVT
jgi:H+/Cl- antiporter ClcA